MSQEQCYRQNMYWIDFKYFRGWFYFNSLYDFTGAEGGLEGLGGLLGIPDKKRRKSSTQVLYETLFK